MSRLCIIPARGGSKRIPGKNIRPFLGKPIIVYSIEAALRSELFDEVMVSTDAEAIANIARDAGAVVPFMRSADNSDDHSSTLDVIEEVIDEYKKVGKEFKEVCCLYPTAPFVTKELLTKAAGLLDTQKYDSVFPVVPFSYPIQRALVKKEEFIRMMDAKYMTSRSQDLETTYHDTGQFYFMKIDPILAEKKLWTDKSFGIVIDELSAQDIDNESDWQLAELKFQLNQKS